MDTALFDRLAAIISSAAITAGLEEASEQLSLIDSSVTTPDSAREDEQAEAAEVVASNAEEEDIGNANAMAPPIPVAVIELHVDDAAKAVQALIKVCFLYVAYLVVFSYLFGQTNDIII